MDYENPFGHIFYQYVGQLKTIMAGVHHGFSLITQRASLIIAACEEDFLDFVKFHGLVQSCLPCFS